jgi:acylglycerol lipase
MLQRKSVKEEFTTRHEEFTWQTNDNKQLFAQCWKAEPTTKGLVLLVHGLGEHSSRYDLWASKFVNEGFSVLSYDMRGHGKTPVPIAKTSSYDKLLNDIDLLINKGKELFPEIPVFLYGHSLGGNLTINYAISRPTNLNGIILTSPWLEVTNHPTRLKFITANVLSKFAPHLRARTGFRPEDISKELRQVHHYRNDPKVHNFINVRLFMKIYEHGLIAKRSIYKINAPLLVLHGSSDKITSCKATQEFVMNSGDKTTYHEIEGGYHELHNDSESEHVFSLISDWLKNHLQN